MTQVAYETPPVESYFAFDGSIAVTKYDFMYHDSDDVKPASSQADATTEALNQEDFAPRFAGLAGDTRKAADTEAVTAFPVLLDVIKEATCASTTFEVGDLVTIDEDSGGTFLSNTLVVKTTNPALAIGKVMRRESSATTKVLVRFVSRVLYPNFYDDAAVAPQIVNPAADSGAGSTILPGSKVVEVGAVVNDTDDWIVLPAVADVPNGHVVRVLCNAGGAFEVRTPASSTTEINGVNCDGTQEYLMVDTEITEFRKVSNTDGWIGTDYPAAGGVGTATVPD